MDPRRSGGSDSRKNLRHGRLLHESYDNGTDAALQYVSIGIGPRNWPEFCDGPCKTAIIDSEGQPIAQPFRFLCTNRIGAMGFPYLHGALVPWPMSEERNGSCEL